MVGMHEQKLLFKSSITLHLHKVISMGQRPTMFSFCSYTKCIDTLLKLMHGLESFQKHKQDVILFNLLSNVITVCNMTKIMAKHFEYGWKKLQPHFKQLLKWHKLPTTKELINRNHNVPNIKCSNWEKINYKITVFN